MKIDFINKHLFIKVLTWSCNLPRDFIKRMRTSQWLLKVPPSLRSHDWEFKMETILIQTRLDVGTESAKL